MSTIAIYQPRSRRFEIPVRIVPLESREQYKRARGAAYNEMRQAWALWRSAVKALRKARLEYKLSKM